MASHCARQKSQLDVKLSGFTFSPTRAKFGAMTNKRNLRIVTCGQNLNLLLVAIALLIAFPADIKSQLAQSEQDKQIDWEKDVEYLASELPKRHKDFFYQLKEADFQAAKDQLLKLATSTKDASIMIPEMMKLVRMCGDGHTSLGYDFKKMHYYPVNVRWFDDGVFIVNCDARYRRALGAKILKVGSRSIEEIQSQFKQILPHDNEAGFRAVFDRAFNTAEFLKYVGGSDDINNLDLELEKEGQQFKQRFVSVPQPKARQIRWGFRPENVPRYQTKRQLNFWNDWLPEQKIVYFKYNRCQDAAGFRKLVNGTKGFIEKNDVEKLVIDLRDNGGGNSSIFNPMLRYLLNESDLNKKGRLFVIIGRRTFSSALWNAVSMKTQTNAILVGEPTGGRPNHFGEVKSFQLPSSGFSVYYSTRRWTLMKDSDPETLAPDIKVRFTSKDYLQGNDPYLQAIIDYSK